MKFMLIMNAPKGPYQVGQWAHEDREVGSAPA